MHPAHGGGVGEVPDKLIDAVLPRGEERGHAPAQVRPEGQVVLPDVIMGGGLHLVDAARRALVELAQIMEVAFLKRGAEDQVLRPPGCGRRWPPASA